MPWCGRMQKQERTPRKHRTRGSSCGWHQRSYCEDCHKTGAIKVQHDEMLYNHAASIRVAGGKACAYCHQPVFCARCHADNVLETQPSKQPVGPSGTSISG